MRLTSTSTANLNLVRRIIHPSSPASARVAGQGARAGGFLDKVNDRSGGKRKEELKLSKRKIEVLELIAEGLVKKEIAERLDIAYGTVETYVKMIYQELEVSNAPSAVSKAYQKGLLKGDENEGER